MKEAIFFAIVLMSSIHALARPVTSVDRVHIDYGEVLSSVQLNAAASQRYTQHIDVRGRTQETVYIDYDRGDNGTATHVTLVCWAGRSRGTMAAVPILYESATLGTRDAIQHKWRFAVSSSGTLRAMITPLNDVLIRCQVGSEGALHNDDSASVYVRTGVL